MALKSHDLSVYLVLDPELCQGIGMVETARRAVEGGVTAVQLRDKTGGRAALIATGRALKDMLAGSGVPLIVNDDAEAAAEIGAHGLHIGQGDGNPARARGLIGPDAILGLSVQTLAQMAEVDPAVVDYVGIGPVFATPTKTDASAPLGFDGLARVVAAAPVPSVAIGGLKHEHAADVVAAGAHGMAVVSAICGRPDPARAARVLVQGLRKARGQ